MTDKLVDALKDYIGTNAKKKIIELATEQITRWLFSKLAFLSWGPLGSIVSYFVTKGVIFVIDQTVIGAHVAYIYLDATFDRKEVENIIKKLRQTDSNLTEDERKKLNDELAKAGRDLIRFNI